VELAQLFGKRSGLTLAPEAGSQRLRDVINKKVTEGDLLRAAEAAYANRWQRIKLYFMIGLPTETDDDIVAIVDLVDQVAQIGQRYHGRRAQVSISVSTLVPKPHTPFQWQPLIDEEVLHRRQDILKQGLRKLATWRQIRFSYHDARVSLLEAIIARGDRRLGPVIEHAWRAGAHFDAWNDQFRWDAWLAAFQSVPGAAHHLDVVAEARRPRDKEQVLPWDHISCGVTKDYLWREYERATQGRMTRDCRDGCTNCGAIDMLACSGQGPAGESPQGKVDKPDPAKAQQTPSGKEAPQAPFRLRILFRKGEEVKYISHLDLLRAWERAIRRSGLPLAYSQGFSPHPKITIALPLPVGCTGESEALDIILTEAVPAQDVICALEPVMPPGLTVLSAREVAIKHPALTTLFDRAVYDILLADIDKDDVKRRITKMLDREEVPVEFRRKTFDLRPLIGSLTLGEASAADTVHRAIKGRTMVLRAVLLGNERGRIGRPDVLMRALELGEHVRRIHRAQVIYRT
jgi:radical SAM-linked protein